jgi:general secretion pathway protein J
MLQRSTPSAVDIRGFTLIELLVAISLMALMTVLSWRGLDGISRSQLSLQQRADEVLTLQATLTQWGSDLDAISSQPDMPGLDWDGRTLRILRHNSATPGEGLVVVAWARRVTEGQGYWLRWQSPALTTRGDLDLAWQKAAIWGQTPSDDDRTREVRTVGLEQWQIFYFRQNAWTNPLSSSGTPDGVSVNNPASAASAPSSTSTSASATLPDGVRLVLALSEGQAVSGTLTRDWVRPILGGSK